MAVSIHTMIRIARSPLPVWELNTRPASIVECFVGYGPIPAVTEAAMVGGEPCAVGRIRRLRNARGQTFDEEIVELEPGRVHAYRMLHPLPMPVSAATAQGRGRWTFAPDPEGTRVDWRFEWDVQGPAAAAFAVVLRVCFAKAMNRCLRRLKTKAEDVTDDSRTRPHDGRL